METTELHYQISSVLVVFVLTLVVSFLIQNIIRRRRMPPGPWGFPIIGHLPLIGDSPFKTFKDMAGQYGDIFMIKMGSWPTVVLNSKESIREAYLTQQNNFVDRPEFFSFKTMQDHRSLAFGKFNKIHRKIANNVLRSFANVKSSTTEEIIQTEAISLSKVLVSSTNPHE
ncbi:hypothetical protein KUTeg_005096 [Tegillarca granosa]|uniref:unspecific monooxygenase n=1 Tax=Tegillarca granosa TaxID=220873 RepID=A0ABQ9FKR7_TEGGR|nr:hypothetical protein KUTeg_005096 [Tegillarca granosa]